MLDCDDLLDDVSCSDFDEDIVAIHMRLARSSSLRIRLRNDYPIMEWNDGKAAAIIELTTVSYWIMRYRSPETHVSNCVYGCVSFFSPRLTADMTDCGACGIMSRDLDIALTRDSCWNAPRNTGINFVLTQEAETHDGHDSRTL